jgi:hypothetical protein
LRRLRETILLSSYGAGSSEYAQAAELHLTCRLVLVCTTKTFEKASDFIYTQLLKLDLHGHPAGQPEEQWEGISSESYYSY